MEISGCLMLRVWQQWVAWGNLGGCELFCILIWLFVKSLIYTWFNKRKKDICELIVSFGHSVCDLSFFPSEPTASTWWTAHTHSAIYVVGRWTKLENYIHW